MDKDNTSKQKVIQFYKKYQKTTNKPESKYVFPSTSNVMEGIIHNFRNIFGLYKKNNKQNKNNKQINKNRNQQL